MRTIALGISTPSTLIGPDSCQRMRVNDTSDTSRADRADREGRRHPGEGGNVLLDALVGVVHGVEV